MKPIPEFRAPTEALEKTIVLENKSKKKLAKSFMNNAGIFVGILLMFAVIIIVTTDIHITTAEELASMGLDFFILLFVSYSMYINCSDSGMRAGLQSKTYIDALDAFELLKKKVIDSGLQGRLGEFCNHYITEEIKNAQTASLASVGIPYDRFLREYMGMDVGDIRFHSELSKVQKKAILRACKMNPIQLTPEMMMKRGRGSSRRSPLGTKPETKKGIAFGTKFITTLVISMMMSMLVLDAIFEPTWTIISTCALKLAAVVVNGFGGYKFGYENVIIDTVHYIDDQADLLQQAMQYLESPKRTDEATESQE